MKKLQLLLVMIFALLSNVSINAQVKTVMVGTESPTATFMNDNKVIESGDSVDLIIHLTGECENGWDVVYSDGTTNHEIHITENPYYLVVSPNKTTIYELVSVNNGCCDGSIEKQGRTGVIVYNNEKNR